MFTLLKTKMIAWNAACTAEAASETRQAVTRNEIAALFASELASSARRT